MTLEAWEELDVRVFQAAWITTGHFLPEHFADASGAKFTSLEDAKHALDPCGVLSECKMNATPQMCCFFEWQIEDWPG